jgi:site-specific recombinase XerD
VDGSQLIRRETFLQAARAPGDDVPAYVTLAEVRAARAAADARTAALIGFLWMTGARISEALAVTVADLGIDSQTVKLPTLKRRRKDGSGRKTSVSRVVPIAAAYLAELLALVVRAGRPAEALIFGIGRRQAWKVIHRAMLAGGIDAKRAHPHTLRHGHAVHAVLNHVPLNLIQRNLGHSSLLTTAIYLRVTAIDVRTAYERFDW